ncbi:telomere maintenance protein [Histomonas meleagridis]|uniref:telomere maintenance protein n=1 Tax=Histomonas meleagridis TaxID=135588 RepID=UPI00355A960F|nr:telomere maintenance protein [Histomonas meleagridis]KAH0800365.1 telomere maintenance protein [Histomonas meleagridis]
MDSGERKRPERSYSWRNRIVFVSNIPYKFKAQDVMLMLRQFGRCYRVDLSRDGIGESRGYAFAEFETPEGARNAAEYLDGAELDGRYLRAEISVKPPNELIEM